MHRTAVLLSAIAFLVLTLVNSYCFAKDSAKILEPIAITASRSSTTEENTPSSVTIITEKEIKEKQYTQVQDLLREELGISMTRSGAVGASTSLFMRGTGSSSTLVLIDGTRANQNTTGAYDFHDLSTDNIGRIEILRGPQSTLWGADALGGIINIITKKGAGDSSHYFSFEGGSYNTFKETAGSSGGNEKLDYSLSVSQTNTGGFSSADVRNGNTEKDGFRNSTISTRNGANFLDDGRVEFIGRYTKSSVGFDGFNSRTGLPTDAPDKSNTESFYISAPMTKLITSWWGIKLSPQVAVDQLRSYDPSFSPNTTDIFNRTYSLDLQNNVTVNKLYSVVFGIDLKRQNGENLESTISKNIDNQGYYLQNVINYEDKAILTGGFRHDVNSVYMIPTTYKIEGAYQFKEFGTKIHSVTSTGFRAPSFNELYFPNFGNPNLKPEESMSWEVGVDQSLLAGKVQVGVTYFDSRLKNLIQFNSPTFLPQNVGIATSKGTETYFKVQPIHELGFSVNHTWNDALDDQGHRLTLRPEQTLSASIHHNWQDKLNSLIGVTYKGGVTDGTYNIKDYAIVRVALSYQLLKDLKITARGENLFNVKHEDIPGYGTAGISGYAGLLYNFN